MAFSKELARYIGNELVGAGAKNLPNVGYKSALSSLVPNVATKVGTSLAPKAGYNMATQGGAE